MEHQLPVAVVCRVLGAPRSSVSARRAQAGAGGRPGPAPSISDHDLVELIRQVLDASPFAGEGYRKIRARLRREHSVRVSGKRVLRLLRREGLLAPQRVRGPRGRGAFAKGAVGREAADLLVVRVRARDRRVLARVVLATAASLAARRGPDVKRSSR
jgi:HTH-like domain